MPFEKSAVRRILLITLSNIGDVVLTFPVLDILCHDFTHAHISVVVGPKAASLLEKNPRLHHVYNFDKHQSVFLKTLPWIDELRKKRFDLVVDLRNTVIPLLVGARYRTPLSNKAFDGHMKEKHLARLRSVYPDAKKTAEKLALWISEEDKAYAGRLVGGFDQVKNPFIALAPGSANASKRWEPKRYAELADELQQQFKARVVFAGDAADAAIVRDIKEQMTTPLIDVCGKTSLPQLAYLLQLSTFAVVNDSAAMHLASYLDVPHIALFGPSKPKHYGPWGKRCGYLQNTTTCLACQGKGDAHTCINAITVKDVLQQIEQRLLTI